MRFFPQDLPATVEWYAPVRADASPTVQVLDSYGSELVAAATAATLDSVATTLVSGAPEGSDTLIVASATGITAGRQYLIAAKEPVVVRAISGTTIYLMSPLWYSHAASAAFEGTRISYDLTSTHTATPNDACVAIFSYLVSTVAQPPGRVGFAISRGNPTSGLTAVDVAAVDPTIRKKLAGVDINALIVRGEDEIRDRISARGVPVYDLWGGDDHKRAVLYQTLYLAAEQYGDSFRDERAEWWERTKTCLDVLASTASTDADRDGKVSTQEAQGGLPRGIRLTRSG